MLEMVEEARERSEKRECGTHTLENTEIRRGGKYNQGRRIKRI